MNYMRKLKPLDEWWVGLIYIGNGVLLLITALLGYWDIYLKFLAILLLVGAILKGIISVRMGNTGYFAGAVNYFIISLLCFFVTGDNKQLIVALLGCFCFTLFWNISLFISKKVKWRKREVLELAASAVDETKNGFTARPKPTGSAEYSPQDIQGFAKFLSKNLVAIPYAEKDKVVMLITKNRLQYLFG